MVSCVEQIGEMGLPKASTCQNCKELLESGPL